MKKIKFSLQLLLISFLLVSCEQNEENINTIFDGSQSLVAFNNASSDLPVIINGTGSVSVTIDISTAASTDRTINITVDEDNSTALTENYSLESSTITIPANSYQATVVVNGVDNTIETTPETIVLNIATTSFDSVLENTVHTINMFQVCPIAADFLVGTYEINQLSGNAPFASIQPAFGNQIVEIVSTGETSRSFDFLYSPENFQSDFNMNLNLVCDFFQIRGRIQSGSLSCDGGDTQIGQGNSATPSPYDTNDDTFLTLFINDFEGPGFDGGCGAQPYEIELTLTKL